MTALSSRVSAIFRRKSIFEEIFFSEELSILYERLANLALTQCNKCPYFAICHGGCPHEASMFGNIMSKTIYWSIYKELYTRIEEDLKQTIFGDNPLREASLISFPSF